MPQLCLAFLCLWFISNQSFFYFLFTNKGFSFTARSIAFTFLDQITMGIGIVSGFVDRSGYFKKTSTATEYYVEPVCKSLEELSSLPERN